MTERSDVTELLSAWRGGDQRVEPELFAVVYDELRKLARFHLRGERPDHTLQPTSLVNQAYLRLVDQRRVDWQSRAHFFGIASKMMRRILIDHARARHAARRGGGAARVTLEDDVQGESNVDVDLLALNDALDALAEADPVAASVVEMRYFGGLTIKETATALDTSESTVKREWRAARSWLFRELGEGASAAP